MTDEVENIARRIEKVFAHNDWKGLYALMVDLYQQGLKDGSSIEPVVPPLPKEPPPQPAKVPPPPRPPTCPRCSGTGECTVSIPPSAPGRQPMSGLGPCPECLGGTRSPDQASSPSQATPVQGEAPKASQTRYVVAGSNVVDLQSKSVVFSGNDADKVAQVLNGV